jgi:hypothetical protein
MPRIPAADSGRLIVLALVAGCAVTALFVWQGRLGFSLWDEGYLWYGTQRVMLGEVPIRDFQSYDPGRYYWSAALMSLWGDNGIVALRGSIAIFQALGLFICLALLASGSTRPIRYLWLPAAITFVVWMFPRHKLFDTSISIALVAILSHLVQQPSRRRYFLTGVAVGLAAVFGQNHGVYGAAASLGVIAYLALGRKQHPGFVDALASWTAGVVIGWLPVLFMMALLPGFALSLWKSVLFLFELGATNLPLPVPWPWLVPFGDIPAVDAARGVLAGLFYIATAAYGVLGIAWTIRERLRGKPVPPTVVASAFLALPYAHFAYSRADLSHLAQGIFPLLIGGLVLLARRPAKISGPFATLLCGASVLVMLPLHPGWQCRASMQCVETDVAGSKLTIDPGTAGDLTMLTTLAGRFAPGNRSFVAAPFWPGAYAALHRRSPMWEIYPLFPRDEAFERAELERIKAADPGFAMILDLPLDGRDELRFRNTHPLIERYIRDHFEPLNGYTPNPAYHLYRGRQATQ